MSTPVGAPDWGGTRLLAAEQVVQQTNFATLAPGASQTYVIAVTRPSYRIRAYFQNTTDLVTITPVQVDMEWDAPGNAFVADRQRWNLFAGDSNAPHYIHGKGPCSGAQLKLTITNNAPATATLAYELLITECAQYFTYHDWHTDDFTQVKFPGYLQVQSDVRAQLLAVLDHINSPANTTVNYALPLFAGPVNLQVNISTAGGNNQFWVLNGSDQAFASNAFYYTEAPIAEGSYPIPLLLPRTQTVLSIANFKAAADTLSFTFIMGPTP